MSAPAYMAPEQLPAEDQMRAEMLDGFAAQESVADFDAHAAYARAHGNEGLAAYYQRQGDAARARAARVLGALLAQVLA